MWQPKKIAVLGAGTMGHGIAQVAAQHGIATSLFDPSPEALARGLAAVGENLGKGVSRGKVTDAQMRATLERLHANPDRDAALAGAELVVEAVPESLELKKRIFAELGELPPSVLLATNTSSLPVGEMAAAARHPERVVGMHFFNPVHLMPLLEVVRAETTGEEAVTRAVDVGETLGKECIVVRDRPGFATSRLGVVLGLEAIRMLEEGVASAEDIDKAMTLGYRHPLGPLRLTDLIGLDVRLAIAEHLHRTLGADGFRPPALLRRLVEEGKLGKKTGEGFYRWS